MRYKLFLDLDGVFADFHRRVFELCGKFPDQLETPSLWKIIHTDKSFFLNLDRMNGFDELWEVSQQFKSIEFLTGAPSSKSFIEQKKLWVAKHFGEQYVCNVVSRKDKQKFAKSEDDDWTHILLDDTKKNINEWIESDGIGIYHDSNKIKDSVQALKHFLN